MDSYYTLMDMLRINKQRDKEKAATRLRSNACVRMPLSIPQDTKRSIVICPSRANTRIFWYQTPKWRYYEIYRS